ncbi:hypothetical protein CORC01_04516, partial [Colletotrichum orchidophilum]
DSSSPPDTLDCPNSGRAHPARWCWQIVLSRDEHDEEASVSLRERRLLSLHVGRRRLVACATAGVRRRGQGILLERGLGGTVVPFYSPSRPPMRRIDLFRPNSRDRRPPQIRRILAWCGRCRGRKGALF